MNRIPCCRRDSANAEVEASNKAVTCIETCKTALYVSFLILNDYSHMQHCRASYIESLPHIICILSVKGPTSRVKFNLHSLSIKLISMSKSNKRVDCCTIQTSDTNGSTILWGLIIVPYPYSTRHPSGNMVPTFIWHCRKSLASSFN